MEKEISLQILKGSLKIYVLFYGLHAICCAA